MKPVRTSPFSRVTQLRRGAAPISQQLRAAVELGVIRGELISGTRLPSVRRLASRLRIAPGTVSRVYQSLIAEGLIESRPRSGYFYVDRITCSSVPAAPSVSELIDEMIAAAERAHVDVEAVIVAFRERVSRRALRSKRIAVVSRQEAALHERRAFVADALADFGAEVVSVSIEELEAQTAGQWLADVTWFLVPVLEFDLVRRLLGPHAPRMIPMTRAVRADVRDFVAKQPPHARFGLIAVREDSMGRLILGVQAIHPLITPPITAPISNPTKVHEVLTHADVVVVSTLARKALEDFGPIPVPSVEFLEVPDAATLERLRTALSGYPKRPSDPLLN